MEENRPEWTREDDESKQGENVKGLFGGFIRLTIPQGWLVQDFCRRTHLDQCDRRKPTDRTGQNRSSFALRPDSQEPGVSITTRKILLAGAVGEHTSGRGAARDGRVRSLKRRQYGKTQPGIDASGPGCGVHRS